jgi:ATP/maltotriose-dependent transcriptional regulator MalT
MTPELCKDILGFGESSTLLDQINKQNLFLTRAGGGRRQ